MSSKLNLAGQRFGRLTVLNNSHYVNGQTRWECLCDCGAKCEVSVGNIRNGHTASCGCITLERISKLRKTHGQTRTPEYRTWCKMLERCENPKIKSYPNYGGRGITVCERWKSFENFFADMGKRPSAKHSIDRFPDNDGDYERNNCRWATQREQCNNKRTNHILTHNGESLTATEWGIRIGIRPLTIIQRLRYGWTVARAITTPVL